MRRARPMRRATGWRTRAARRRGTALAFAVVASLSGARPGAAQSPVRLVVLDTAALQAVRLTESSGAAMSAITPGVVWTHNDSGDGPYLYATDSAGRDLGRRRVEGAHATDWEDLAAGPCVIVPGRCLYVGDIGDNRRRRRHVVVYRLREPPPPRAPSDTLGTAPLLDSIGLRYPGRPHNAEALAVTGDGTLFLITKDVRGPPRLFRGDVRNAGAREELAALGALAMAGSALTGRLATGAAVSPGDSLLVVRTYVSVHFFRLHGGSVPTPTGPPAGITIPFVEPQGEGITFDGPERLVLTSERDDAARGMIVRLRILTSPSPAAPTTH